MRQLETVKGQGTVTSNGGTVQSVKYELSVWQREIAAGTPHATIPGLQEITGRVLPVCFFTERDLILQIQDGRKLTFSFTDRTGTIASSSGWAGEPSI
jgi:hypothetical protein